MIKPRHFLWLTLALVVIIANTSAFKGVYYGEGEVLGSASEANTVTVVAVDSASIAPTVPPTLAPTSIPTEVAVEASVEINVTGNSANGQMLFQMQGCSSCHMIDSESVLVGPSLMVVKDVAGSRIPDLTAEQYIHESIVDPNAYVVAGFPIGVMPQTFGTMLTEDQINDLVAYLLTR